jgi:hypothetical protein
MIRERYAAYTADMLAVALLTTNIAFYDSRLRRRGGGGIPLVVNYIINF